ncbi:serine/threonine-protein kinase [Pseudosporangium ferrugineum]|uniref:non-specific serine/threonine protein kinase n=1 Tax=Pseudosporangium ferrugineum TaxID=439699 RepID=A0A2T0SDL1_9ACTN|nr:serine/threonine-protein kinase [Pseudosporangium ferrugineum]PRY31413.1 serine/threonine-protein kinase [Pseudosporangium ferrugineum]
MEVRQRVLGGRYTLLEPLGSGGMAVVRRARDEVLGRDVAIKLLAGRHAGDATSRSRIRDEARAAATLSHPHIAQVYDYGEAEEQGRRVPYVVMELIRGITLQQRAASGVLYPPEICRIGAQVASALAAAHALGLVHRDIKPANVMVTRDGVKVVDFGLAATAGPGEPGEELLGTPAYLAPERLTGATVLPASDVYALGVLLYRLLAGESPWAVDSTTQMLTAHVTEEPCPLPPLPGVAPEIVALVERCLHKDPAARPTAAEAARVLAGERTGTTQVLPAPPVPEADRPRRRWLLVAAAAAVLLAGAGWVLLPPGARGGAEPVAVAPSPPPPPPVPTRPGPAPATTVPAGVPPAPPPVTTTKARPAPGTPRGTAPPPGRRDPAPGTRTFRSAGGTVTARCDDRDRAVLVSYAAVKPYKVERVNPGSAAVVFRHGKDRIRVRVSCKAGTPTATTRP